MRHLYLQWRPTCLFSRFKWQGLEFYLNQKAIKYNNWIYIYLSAIHLAFFKLTVCAWLNFWFNRKTVAVFYYRMTLNLITRWCFTSAFPAFSSNSYLHFSKSLTVVAAEALCKILLLFFIYLFLVYLTNLETRQFFFLLFELCFIILKTRNCRTSRQPKVTLVFQLLLFIIIFFFFFNLVIEVLRCESWS